MKQFFKNVAATIVGIFGFGIIMVILAVITLIGMICNSSKTPSLKDNSVMVMKLQGQISDQANDDWLGQLTGNQYNNLGMNNILSAIKKAKQEDKVKGIYLETGILSTDYATLQEIRNALADFKKSGKWIIAYGDAMTQGGYYLASVANKIYVNPEGSVDWHGIASQTQYIKDVAAKFGVHFTIVKVGKYKSFTEMYTEDKMSDANREQVTTFITSIWGQVTEGVSTSRNISVDSLNVYADRMLMFYPAEESVKCGLADTLIYRNDVRNYLKKLVEINEDDNLPILGLGDMMNVRKNVPKDKSGNIVAVYYASGEITDYPSSATSEDGIVGSKVIRDLRKLKDNDDVKAVVLRVNSPGGSAFASEQIWHAVKELKTKKPVIVSMGDYAASGGYYISCVADTIVAEPTTLTGSIGIFGMIPNVKGLTDKIGLSYDVVKTNKYADFGNIMRPFNEGEKALLQMTITEGYNTFLGRCAEGRHMTKEAIEKIAEGRVWTGEAAKELGLVDELGGIDKALDIAVAKADIENYTVISYPAKQDFFSSLFETKPTNYVEAQLLKSKLGEYYRQFDLLKNLQEKSMIQARVPFELNIK